MVYCFSALRSCDSVVGRVSCLIREINYYRTAVLIGVKAIIAASVCNDETN